MKSNIQAYFVDLDGTFLDQYDDPNYPVSQTNLQMAKKINQTKNFIISTGRSNSDFVVDLAKRINSKYLICQNGAIILDVKKNKILRNNLIDNETVHKIKNFMQINNLHYTINGDPIIYTNNPDKITLDRPWAKDFKKLPYEKANLNQEINRLLAFGLNTIEETNKLSEQIMQMFPNLRTHKVSKGLSLEITNALSTKGIGDEFVAKLLNVNLENVWHIGDSGNDISVKEQNIKLAVMQNAIDSIKKEADLITFDYQNAGVAKTIELLEQFYQKGDKNVKYVR
ncbi:HAD hydrolase family protein [Mycoplasma sp. 744]|uniref:HAD hydrolase family protein n=1 Tax=Mycoplasma sp. 744 TaxID=3108531 RepID=UPI002B1E1779|nr:HAD hydrolase family protein [Mycoplasma sp. 744]MEA4115480.1 HAD hydrolase family protein [Mycoplasma sp. 744]